MAIIILFCLIQIVINQKNIETEIKEEIMEQEIQTVTQTEDEINIWQIEIPKILVMAKITEGTSKEKLEQYVGHFETTSKENGNIGLAAYNRGNIVNYFKDLKLLKEGDEIIYRYNKFEKKYEVKKCRIIKNTETRYLDKTDKNMLTLITYIENYPEYRRCIQAVEKDEN